MDLLEDVKILFLNFSFVMIYINHKMSVLLENHLNYLKDSIFECFCKEYVRLLFFPKKIFFLQNIMTESLTLEEENIIKDTTYLFRLKEELNCTAIKHIRNLFRLEKETKEIKGRILRDIKNLFEHEEEKNML